jgi:hypothetical protein
MLITQVAKLSAEERFLYWVGERHQVYLRKQAKKPKPWTDDEVLQMVYFTNPYREHDKVTAWYRQHIREPLQRDPEVVFATICFRWFNWIPTGQLLRDTKLLVDWDCRRAVAVLTAYRNSGYQVFTGAFNISNSGSRKPKVNRVCEDYVTPAWKRDFSGEMGRLERLSLAELHGEFSQLPGLGGSGFMAAQVVCDLKYTPFWSQAGDWWTWCSPGPGSRRGLAILLDNDRRLSTQDFLIEVNKLRVKTGKMLVDLSPLHAQDVQNCLCEFGKYERARTEGGKARRKYNGRS